MQFFTATLLLVVLAQSNAQSGREGIPEGPDDDGRGQYVQELSNDLIDLNIAIDRAFKPLIDAFGQKNDGIALGALEEVLSEIDYEGENLVYDLEDSLEGNLTEVLPPLLAITDKTILGLASGKVKPERLPTILLSLGSVLQFDNNASIKIAGGVFVALGALLDPLLDGNATVALRDVRHATRKSRIDRAREG